LRHYELVLIINPELGEDETNALIERVKDMIESSEGKILKIDPWGSKRLAYPIRRHTDGYYVLYIFESQPNAISQLNNSLRLIESILRHMIVLFEGDLEKMLAAVTEAVQQKAEAQPQEEDKEDALDSEDEEYDEDDMSENYPEDEDEDHFDVNQNSDES
jgi:small subunit ribosomal protein S6